MTTHDIDFVLRRGVFEIIVEQELRERLLEDKPLRLKMGFDPTRPDLHLGHAVALRKLRQLQELGHKVVLIVGDWTARIGDPSGQAEMRTMMTEEEVNANAETYIRQFFRIVDRDRTEMALQSEWFGRFGLADVIGLTRRFTVAQMLARQDFAQRYAANRPIAITEFLYPLLQGYDSVAINSDVEFGGSDQKFNCLVGRDLQGMVGQRPQQVFLVPLLVGTDGRKMSKSFGNYIAFEDPPNEMYGKVMSIADNVMMEYFELLTDVPDEELAVYRYDLDSGMINPMSVKHRLASEIVKQFYGAEQAGAAERHFRATIQDRSEPAAIPSYGWTPAWHLNKLLENEAALRRFLSDYGEHLWPLLGVSAPLGPTAFRSEMSTVESAREKVEQFMDQAMGPGSGGIVVGAPELLVEVGLAASKSEARRLIEQGGIYVDQHPLSSLLLAIRPSLPDRAGTLLRRGNRRYVRIAGAP